LDSQPNLKPPITTTEQALAYKATLEKIEPSVEYLMTLYLSPDLTPDEIRKAAAAGIAGKYFSRFSILFS
jgi:dihydroorotase